MKYPGNSTPKDVRKPPNRSDSGGIPQIQHGEFVVLTGRSGSGKSTLLYLLSTLDNPSSGEICLDEKEVSRFSKQELHRFRNQKIGFVFQFHYLLPELTALENVLMPAVKAKQVERATGGRHRFT